MRVGKESRMANRDRPRHTPKKAPKKNLREKRRAKHPNQVDPRQGSLQRIR